MRDPRAELVRIDSHGQGHPIGNLASQRLRSRMGTYRMLPSPEHVVLMRRTREDGRRDADDGPVVRMAGEITARGVMCDVVALLGQTGWRGELLVFEKEHERSIFFDQGNVLGTVTSVEAERIGSILYKFGVIDAGQRGQALSAQATGKRFGEVALELGFLGQEQLYQFMAKQVEEIVFAVLGVADGTFFFLDGFDDTRLVVRHTVSANALLMDSVTRMDEMRFFRQTIPSGEHVPVRIEGRTSPSDFSTVHACIDGKCSLEEIGRLTGLGEFECTKQAYALVQSHHVVIHPPRVSGGPAAIVAAANGALRTIFLATASAGCSEELWAGLASFAVGAGVYDILLRGAGPDSEGQLNPKVVVQNSILVAGGGDPAHVLQQMLHEYVSFALFSAGASLGSGAEAELVRQVSPMLSVLRPVG